MNDSLFRLDGKTAVVTGGAGLLGRQHCAALAQAGAAVIVADSNEKGAEDTAAEIRRRYDRPARAVLVDVSDRDGVLRILEGREPAGEGIDILVNNAALDEKVGENPSGAPNRFEDYSETDWDRAFAVNVRGTFLCSQIIGTHMAQRGGGSIINIASTYGVVGPDQALYRSDPDGPQEFYKSPAYPATKGAVIAFTRYLASYWGDKQVRVNTLSPGGVRTEAQDMGFVTRYSRRTPLGRMAAPDDYRGALVFLASDASRYMTGANLIVDGGWTAW